MDATRLTSARLSELAATAETIGRHSYGVCYVRPAEVTAMVGEIVDLRRKLAELQGALDTNGGRHRG